MPSSWPCIVSYLRECETVYITGLNTKYNYCNFFPLVDKKYLTNSVLSCNRAQIKLLLQVMCKEKCQRISLLRTRKASINARYDSENADIFLYSISLTMACIRRRTEENDVFKTLLKVCQTLL